MATYTIELRKIIDYYGNDAVKSWFTNYNLSDYLLPSQIEVINKAGIWNKEKLAQKIIDHYYMREIGFETPALFSHYAKVTMQEIMEKYLPLIYTNSIEYDPLINVDYTETFAREINGEAENFGESNSNSSNNASGLSVNSDTPQGQINKQDILNGAFASSTGASETESSIQDNTHTSSNGTSNTKENYTKNIKGNSGITASYQKMIEQFRDNIISIDKNIINELQDLFMGLY